jgi:hypothetical protein
MNIKNFLAIAIVGILSSTMFLYAQKNVIGEAFAASVSANTIIHCNESTKDEGLLRHANCVISNVNGDKDKITSIAALITAFAACITIIVTVRNARKETFIQAITTARKEYIYRLRKLLAKFCTEASTGKNKDQLKKLGYQLQLMMNPARFDDWDKKAVKLIDDIIYDKKNVENNDENNVKNDIEYLVALMQSWLALEWHGMMEEGKKGILPEEKKEEFRARSLSEFKEYCKGKGIEYNPKKV